MSTASTTTVAIVSVVFFVFLIGVFVLTSVGVSQSGTRSGTQAATTTTTTTTAETTTDAPARLHTTNYRKKLTKGHAHPIVHTKAPATTPKPTTTTTQTTTTTPAPACGQDTYLKQPLTGYALFGSSVFLSDANHLVVTSATETFAYSRRYPGDSWRLVSRKSGVTLSVTGQNQTTVVAANNAVYLYFGSLLIRQFGFAASALATGGDTIVMGVPDSNKVYVYPQDLWIAGEGKFGFSVATDGKQIVVGAPYSKFRTGAAYLYDTEGRLQRTLVPETPKIGDLFGSAVAVNAGTILVGAPGQDRNAYDAGMVYRFGARGYTEIQASNPGTNDNFGASLALSADGRAYVVGAPGEDSGMAGNQEDNSKPRSGAVYGFYECSY